MKKIMIYILLVVSIGSLLLELLNSQTILKTTNVSNGFTISAGTTVKATVVAGQTAVGIVKSASSSGHIGFLYVSKQTLNDVKDNLLTDSQELAYPNPSNDIINFRINLNLSTNTILQIYNSEGLQIQQIDITDKLVSDIFSLDISKYPVGAYFFRLSGSDIIKNGSFVVFR